MQRHLLGFITAITLLLTAGLWLCLPEGATKGPLVGAGLRVGIMLSVLWLALPNVFLLLERFPAWLVGTTFVGLIIMAVRPRMAPVLAPILIALWALAPQWFGKRR